LERIATLRHPNMKLIPYLKEVRAVGADDDDDDDSGASDSDTDSDDSDDDRGGHDGRHDSSDDGDGLSAGDDSNRDSASALRQDSSKTVRCKICGYEWQPKRKPEEIRQCPRCNTRKWRGNDAT